MLFANIWISKGSKIPHGWYIHLISYEMTIKNFFAKLVNKKIFSECNITIINSEIIEYVKLNEILVSVTIQVSLDCNIIELTKNIRIHIYY